MAHRKNKQYFVADSEEVQGEGSYVRFQRVTWGVLQNYYGTEVEEKKVASMILSEMIVDWDWVDDDDNPLPKPPLTPEIIENLPVEEMMFLTKASGLGAMLNKDDVKN